MISDTKTNLNTKKLLLGGVILLLLAVGGFSYWSLSKKQHDATILFPFPNQATVGQTITVPLKVSTTRTMNAAEFSFIFPADLVAVESISTNDSFFQLWIKDEPRFDNTLGRLSAAGGLPKPGFVGKNGLVVTATFRFKQAGSGQISLDPAKSRILAHDGLGTTIATEFEPIPFTVR